MSPPIRGYGFKLTDQDGYTRRGLPGETLWAPGVSRTTSGRGRLCGAGYTHFYSDPFTAAIFNQIHATIRDPRGWIVAYGGKVLDDRGRKMGASYVQVLEEAPALDPTTNQRMALAILCSLEVCQNAVWRVWAEEWLAGGDRSIEAAQTTLSLINTRFTTHLRPAYCALYGAAAKPCYRAYYAYCAINAACAAFGRSFDLSALTAWALTLGED